MKKITFLLWLWVSLLVTHAQNVDFNNYQTLISTGTLPDEFSTSSREKAEKAIRKVSNKEDKMSKRAKKEFLLTSAFGIDQLLLSGSILYNDPLSEYVTQVLNEVIKDNEGSKKEARVYVMKSTEVNAFATDQGIIIVTMGMLARLENEAQLAYLLCHEYIHYQKKHSINKYVENKKIEKDNPYTGGDELGIEKSRYSKEKELEADLLGLEIYLESNYDLAAPNELMNVLGFSDRPISRKKFDPTTFNGVYHTYPASYILNKVNDEKSLEDIENNDDEESSHPNLNRRKSEISATIGERKKPDAKKFIVSEEKFMLVRKMAQFEMLRLLLLERSYEMALYEAYGMLDQNPESVYLHTVISRALYGLSTYAAYKSLNKVHIKPADSEGELHRITHFVESHSRIELTLIALYNGWKTEEKFPENREIADINDELMKTLVNKYGINKYWFKTAPRDTTGDFEKMKAQLAAEEEDKENSESGSTKKKKKKKEKKATVSSGFLEYAFIDIIKDEKFIKRMQKAWDARDLNMTPDKDANVAGASSEESTEEASTESKSTKKSKKINVSRNSSIEPYYIDKILVFDPSYTIVDERRKEELRLSASEEKKKKFNAQIETVLKAGKFDYVIIDPKQVQPEDVDLYNDIALLNDYFGEYYSHKKINMLPTDHIRIRELTTRYETPYITNLGVFNLIEKRDAVEKFLIAVFIFNPITLPISISMMASPKIYTMCYGNIIDMNLNKTLYSDSETFRINDSPDIIKSTIYSILINGRQKEEPKEK